MAHISNTSSNNFSSDEANPDQGRHELKAGHTQLFLGRGQPRHGHEEGPFLVDGGVDHGGEGFGGGITETLQRPIFKVNGPA